MSLPDDAVRRTNYNQLQIINLMIKSQQSKYTSKFYGNLEAFNTLK